MASRPSVLSRFRVVGVSIIIGVSLVGTIFYGLVNSHYMGEILGRTLGPYSDSLAEVGFNRTEPDIWQRISKRHGVQILVEPAEGDPFAFDFRGEPSALAAPEGSHVRATRTGADGTRVTFYWRVEAFRGRHLPLLLGLLFTISVVVGSAFWYLQRQLRPLGRLRSGVDALARGDFETRVPVVRDDEIGQVAEAFNSMAGRVGEMIDDRERLLADVSHELRSPISRMKVALEFVPEGDKRDALSRDLKEMEKLIAVLLEREQLRSRAGRLEGEEVDLNDLVGEVAASFADSGPGVEFEPNGAVAIHADPELVKLLVRNLVDNAVKFSHPDSQPVVTTLEARDDEVVLHVADDGIGIPAESGERLLEPFVKLNRARGHHVGYGIGLNLCQRIVQLHGGTIELLRREPRGTEAIATFRRRPASS